MTTRRVLVTGAGGFVASHLIPRLLARGDAVHSLDATELGTPLAGRFASRHAADLRDPDAVQGVVREARPDVVIHLAAQSSAGRSFADPTGTFHVNALGTWHLLTAVRDETPGARVLAVGTGEVYGPQPAGSRVAEDAPFRPVSPYALSKAAADAMAEVAARAWNLDVVRTRSFGHTGPGQTPTFVIPAWAEQIGRIERGEAEPVLRTGNLDVTRDLTDVRDVVEAYLALIERGRAGAVYNVCRGEGVALGDVAARLCALASVPVRVEVDPGRVRAVDVPYLVGDPSSIARDTGWRATIPFDRTLADVLAPWRTAAR